MVEGRPSAEPYGCEALTVRLQNPGVDYAHQERDEQHGQRNRSQGQHTCNRKARVWRIERNDGKDTTAEEQRGREGKTVREEKLKGRGREEGTVNRFDLTAEVAFRS